MRVRSEKLKLYVIGVVVDCQSGSVEGSTTPETA